MGQTDRIRLAAFSLLLVLGASPAGAVLVGARPAPVSRYAPPFAAAPAPLLRDLSQLSAVAGPALWTSVGMPQAPALDAASAFDRRAIGPLASRLTPDFGARLSNALAAGTPAALTAVAAELQQARAAAAPEVVAEARRRAAEISAQWREGRLSARELEEASAELAAYGAYGEDALRAARPIQRLSRRVNARTLETRDAAVGRALRGAKSAFAPGEAAAAREGEVGAAVAAGEGGAALRLGLRPFEKSAAAALAPGERASGDPLAPAPPAMRPAAPAASGWRATLARLKEGGFPAPVSALYESLRASVSGTPAGAAPAVITGPRLAAVAEGFARAGDLLPVPELDAEVAAVEALLASPALEEAIAGDVPLQRFRLMLRTTLAHLQFRFDSEVDSPAYELYYRAPFPMRPTLEALAQARWFLETADAAGGTAFARQLDAMDARVAPLRALVARRAVRPGAAGRVLPEDDALDRMLADPIGEYAALKARLREDGENARFRDVLGQPVAAMIASLEKPDELEALYPSLGAMRGRVLARLRGLSAAELPYRPTLDAVVQTLVYFDVVERSRYGQSKDYHRVERSWLSGDPKDRLIEPLYHYDRYQYHWFSILADPDLVIVPVTRALDFMDLVKVRSVPIGLVGVESRVVWADRHYQSPIDFFFHDVNHVRRMTGYMNGAVAAAGAATDAEKLAVYREMDAFLARLSAATEPAAFPPGRSASVAESKEEALKKLMRAIVFEVVHESALAATPEHMVYDLTRTPTMAQPFEYMTVGPDRIANLEQERRTDSGSLASGVSYIVEGGGDARGITVHYTMDRALSFLSTVHNKMTRNFYDSVYDPDESFMPLEYRTPEMVAEAAHRLFLLMGEPSPGLKTLNEWAASTDGNLERFVKYTTHEKARELNLSVGSLAAAKPGTVTP